MAQPPALLFSIVLSCATLSLSSPSPVVQFSSSPAVLFSLVLSCATSSLSSPSLVYTWEDLGRQDFPYTDLEVAEEEVRNSTSCPGTEEIVTYYKFPWRTKEGELREHLVGSVKQIDQVIETLKIGLNNTDIHGSVQIRPLLNCKDQGDPDLIRTIRESYLHHPSVGQYNFEEKNPKTVADGQPLLLDQTYFHERKRGGFYIEAGAFDGESDSTSLHYELHREWSGLLVEPHPLLHSQLRTKGRKAWSVQTCLSTQKRPETVAFELDNFSGTMYGIVEEESGTSVQMQCLPLYSLLLALDNPTVDLLSLDIEGAEYRVLETLPWDKVDIRAISVETQFAGEVMEGSREDIHQLLTGLGYIHLAQIARDDVYVLLEAGGLSPAMTLPEVAAKTRLPRGCVYFRVPTKQLASHCRKTCPRDFFMDQPPDALPDCITRTTCPSSLASLAATVGNGIPWTTLLTDTCQLIVNSRDDTAMEQYMDAKL